MAAPFIFLLQMIPPFPSHFFFSSVDQIFSSFSFSVFLLLTILAQRINFPSPISKHCPRMRTSIRDLHCLRGLVYLMILQQYFYPKLCLVAHCTSIAQNTSRQNSLGQGSLLLILPVGSLLLKYSIF